MSYIYFRRDGTECKSVQYEKVVDYVFKDYPDAELDETASIVHGADHSRFRVGSRLVAVIWCESVVKGINK